MRATLAFNGLKEWEKITSDKRVLEAVKEAKTDVNNINKIPLNDLNFTERFSQTVIPLIQSVSINWLLNSIIQSTCQSIDY